MNNKRRRATPAASVSVNYEVLRNGEVEGGAFGPDIGETAWNALALFYQVASEDGCGTVELWQTEPVKFKIVDFVEGGEPSMGGAA